MPETEIDIDEPEPGRSEKMGTSKLRDDNNPEYIKRFVPGKLLTKEKPELGLPSSEVVGKFKPP